MKTWDVIRMWRGVEAPTAVDAITMTATHGTNHDEVQAHPHSHTRVVNLLNPVSAAALRLYNETRAYLEALQAGERPDEAPMQRATTAYADALEASWKAAGGEPE